MEMLGTGMTAKVEEELRALEEGRIDLNAFPHLEHVRLGFEMLGRYPFAEAAWRFGNGLRRLTSRAGKPEVYHETVTIAFLALIAERRERTQPNEWQDFIAQHPELAEKNILERWYEASELKSEIARKTFILPASRTTQPR